MWHRPWWMAITPVDRLTEYVSSTYARLGEVDPRAALFPIPAVSVPFTEWESEWFLRGVTTNLYAVVPQPTNRGHQEMTYVSRLTPVQGHFFAMGDRRSGRRIFAREGIVQFAAVTELVHRYG